MPIVLLTVAELVVPVQDNADDRIRRIGDRLGDKEALAVREDVPGAIGEWRCDCARKREKSLGCSVTRIFNLMFDIPTFQRPSGSLFIGARAR